MLRDELQHAIYQAVDGAFPEAEIDTINITHPTQPEHGDYSTNAAMVLARHYCTLFVTQKFLKLNPVIEVLKLKNMVEMVRVL